MSTPTQTSARKLRVGSVPYLVGRPLDLGLADEDSIALEHHVPAQLVARLRAGELDVALVSSIELFRQPGYRYISDLAVAGAGFVASVQVFLRKPLAELRSIALDPDSRTAATLVRVLFAGDAQPGRGDARACEFIEVEAGTDPRSAPADAWLRIGDQALREYLSADALPVFNPALEWKRRTGLPFVFALWIVRPGAVIDAQHLDAFTRARARGHDNRALLAESASRQWRVPLEACRKYLFEECLYEPGDELEPALFAFRDRAARLGLCSPDLTPTALKRVARHVS